MRSTGWALYGNMHRSIEKIGRCRAHRIHLSYELSGFLAKLYMIFAECLYAVARNHYALTLGEYPDLDSHMLEAHPWQVRG